MIIETIDALRSGNYYGAGEEVERAKGKYQLALTIEAGSRKVRRKIQAAKWLKEL